MTLHENNPLKRESLLNSILDSTADGILVIDYEGKITHANQKFIEMWRIPEHFIKSGEGPPMREYVLEQLKNPDEFVRKTDAHIEGLKEFYEIIEFKDGRVFEEYSRPLANNEVRPGRLWSYRDITKQRNTERKLRENEELLNSTLESVTDGILVVDTTGRVTHFNERFREMWRIPHEVMKSNNAKTLLEYVHDQIEESNIYTTSLEKLLASTEELTERIYFKDGRVYIRYSRPLVSNLTNGERLWTYRDITEQCKSEETLRDQKNLLFATLESVSVGILLVDKEGKIIDWNSKFHQMWRIPLEVMETKDSQKMIGIVKNRIKDPDAFVKEIERSTQTTDETIDIVEMTDGQVIERTSFPLIKNEVLDGRVWCFRDISEERKAEESKKELMEQLEQAEKLEWLGQLAGGVAHDLNNMLGPVVGYSEMLIRDLRGNAKAIKRAEKIRKSAEQAAVIIQDLLTLARRGKYEMRPLLLNDVIIEYMESPSYEKLKTKFPNTKMDLSLIESKPVILGSSPHLSKALMNLVTNAFEAMPDGGNLTIVTEIFDNSKSKFVVLKIKDTGHGIEKEDISKIFEPFFSKKPMGASGTGLGLSVVYGIVRDHKGICDVQSKPGVGTEFSLFFPFSDTEFAPKQGTIFSTVGGNETILVVDDSLEQRELSHEIICNLGYFVVTAPDGHLAVELIRTHPVDLVILDMIMEPGFDGLDTFKEMIKITPNQKAIVVSGFSESGRVHELLELGAATFLKKPYSIDALANAIRDALDSNKPVAVV